MCSNTTKDLKGKMIQRKEEKSFDGQYYKLMGW